MKGGKREVLGKCLYRPVGVHGTNVSASPAAPRCVPPRFAKSCARRRAVRSTVPARLTALLSLQFGCAIWADRLCIARAPRCAGTPPVSRTGLGFFLGVGEADKISPAGDTRGDPRSGERVRSAADRCRSHSKIVAQESRKACGDSALHAPPPSTRFGKARCSARGPRGTRAKTCPRLVSKGSFPTPIPSPFLDSPIFPREERKTSK